MELSGTLSRTWPFCNHTLSGFSPSHDFMFKPSRGFAKSRVGNSRLAGTLCVYCVAGKRKSKAKGKLLVEEAAERFFHVEENPNEGVSFTLGDFERLMSKYEYGFENGGLVKGKIFAEHDGGALVEIGAKAPAFLPLSEASLFHLRDIDEAGLSIGSEDEFMIISNDNERTTTISLKQIQMRNAWERIRQLQSEDATVWGTIISGNHGGIVVLVESLTAFLPFSLTTPGKEKRHWLGKRLPLKIKDIFEEQGRVIVNHKGAIDDVVKDLVLGSVVNGTVQAIKPYGVFIDVGGNVNGLLHVSQVSNAKVSDLRGVFQPGDKVKVMILSHDTHTNRLGLSTKKLEPSTGDMLHNPALVFEKAEEMAMRFRQRIVQAEVESRVQARVKDDSSELNLDFLNKSTGINKTSSHINKRPHF